MTDILYREQIGAGDDKDHSRHADGLLVTLSFFESNTHHAKDHYLLHSIVMKNREVVVDEIEFFRSTVWRYEERPPLIRKAIAKMDELQTLNADILANAWQEQSS